MNHFYHNIEGWCSFEALYRNVVEKYDNALFVEVGTWLGRSAAFLAVEILNSQKNIKLHCVDTWLGSDECAHNNHEFVKQNILFEKFLDNIKPVCDIATPVRDLSINAALKYDDESIDFVFIDASHDYENVKNDLNAWYSKVKRGGTFGGHDYCYAWPGVMQAVDEFATANNLSFDVINDPFDTWYLIKA